MLRFIMKLGVFLLRGSISIAIITKQWIILSIRDGKWEMFLPFLCVQNAI